MGTEKGNFDPTYLTHAARKNLRHLFLNAEAAMTGANFAVASTGDIVVCTNEGNADMGDVYKRQGKYYLKQYIEFSCGKDSAKKGKK